MKNTKSNNSLFGDLGGQLKKNFKYDMPAAVVVFLVALPLCLGIALASGAPLFAGLIAGIVGGIVVGFMSGSHLSVSGPAAGLTVIVLGAITQLGDYRVFLLALVLAGVLQLVLGLIKAGTIGNYFPSSVIEGMLAAIGVILILKQIPLALGVDTDFFAAKVFTQSNSQNSFSAIGNALSEVSVAAFTIALLSILILIYWPKVKAVSKVPAPLVVVVMGIVLSLVFQGGNNALRPDQMVAIPLFSGWSEFLGLFNTPDFSAITNGEVWVVAGTIAIVASLETLLGVEAVDKIDPLKRVTPTNRELIAQGVGNISSGLIGGLPMTSVIVRSSANVNAGAKSKMSAVYHGIMLLLALLIIPNLINMIPLACLAAILLVTGYKLTRVALYKHMYHKGWNQFVPFILTIIAVVFTDLLKGVAVGMVVSVFYLLRTNMRNSYFYKVQEEGNKKNLRIKLAEEVSFLNKAAIQILLADIPKETNVIIDGSNSKYIDPDVLEAIFNYKHSAYSKGIIVTLENVKKNYTLPKLTNNLELELKN